MPTPSNRAAGDFGVGFAALSPPYEAASTFTARGTTAVWRKVTPKAQLVVRSVVSDLALRDKFDHWYSTEHLAWALDVFKADKGWRFWSKTDAGVHYAVYQFADMERLDAALKSEGFKALVADFDRSWPSGVTRTRDILSLVEERDGVA